MNTWEGVVQCGYVGLVEPPDHMDLNTYAHGSISNSSTYGKKIPKLLVNQRAGGVNFFQSNIIEKHNLFRSW